MCELNNNRLCSESDLIAQYDRQVLLENTANILKNNIELSQRLAHLETQLDATRSVTTKRTVSVASTILEQQIPGITATTEVTPRASMQPGDGARVFQFEPVLKASRVYRRAKRDTADYSFCSSIPLSHAWTALSDMSLGDISIISVIALPVQMTELANADRYEFTDWLLGGEEEDNASQRPGSKGSMTTRQLADTNGPTTILSMPSIQETPPSSPGAALGRSTKLRVIVIGALEADVNSMVAGVRGRRTYRVSLQCRLNMTQFANPPYVLGDPRNLVNVYEKTCVLDDLNITLTVEAVNALSHEYSAGSYVNRFPKGDMFMLAYKIKSWESFRTIQPLARQVLEYKNMSKGFPMMIVGTHRDDLGPEDLNEDKGQLLAKTYAGTYVEVSEARTETIHDAFLLLVRQRWRFEEQQYYIQRMLSPKNRLLKLVRGKNENDRRRMPTQPTLGAIQEV